jgi:ATP/maltotriose-dependent transcriptional regulator MalT
VQPARLTRARLNERLARAAQYPIALIVAPAGFGKSVALRDFLQRSRSDALYYDVRREDGTLLAFARRFSDVIAPLVRSASASFASLQEQILSVDDAPRLVCDWFAEHLRRTIGTIVIDDLHFAATDPQSIAFLADLVERTRERIHWTVASRSDAGLPVATWLAYGLMGAPIDQNDLRFTLDEALAAAQATQTNVQPAEVQALWNLTEGWPVALAIALRTHTHAADLFAAPTRELIYRYLAEQILTRLPPAQREFLIATSVFSTFDAAIAHALGGDAQLVEELRRDVAFLSEIAPGQYRYHDLFRDYLETELMRRGENVWRSAVSKGGRLLEERANATAALELYTKAKDTASVLAVVERRGFQLFERGQAAVLAAALDVLPDELRGKSPAALGLQATLEAARGHFEPACRGFVAAIERADKEDLRLALVHRYAIELVRHGQDAAGLLERHSSGKDVPAALRAPLLGTLATAYAQTGRFSDALTTINLALDSIDPTFSDDARARLYQQAAHIFSERAEHDLARRYAMHAIDLAMTRNLYDVAMRAYSVLYVIACDDSDDPISGLAILDKLLDCARKGASSQGVLYGLMASYDIEADRGNEDALNRIEELLADIPGTLPRSRSEMLLPGRALRAACHGDFRRAHELLSQAAAPQSDERRAEQFSELALYASVAGMPEQAQSYNAEALAALERCRQSLRGALRGRLMLALFELARGHNTSAHRHLGQVKRELEPSMSRLEALYAAALLLYRSAIGQGDQALLAGALERLRAEEFGGMARLLEAIPFPGTASGGYASLSATEREILQQLVAGGSTRDVAARTSRSPRTIDAHVQSICKKLNCRGRREAVALAIGAGWVHNEL